MKFSNVCLPLLIVLGQGCSTTNYLLEPGADAKPSTTTYYRGGLRYQVQKSGPIQVDLAFDHMSAQTEALFTLSVANSGDSPFTFNPATIVCQATDSNSKTVATNPAVDPEARIAELVKEDSQLAPSGVVDAAQLLNTTSGVMSAIANDQKAEAQSEEQSRQYDRDELERQSKRAKVQFKLEYWRTRTLRTTTLKKGDSVSGWVACPIPNGDDYVALNVSLQPMPAGALVFPFKNVESP